MTIRDLHKLAYARVPRERVHEILHEQAVALGCKSLKECTRAQLIEIAGHVRMMPLLRCTGPQGQRGHAYGPRERGRGTEETLKRKRPGTASNPRLKIISDKQRNFIRALASEIGWEDDELSKWLWKYFEVDSIDALATSANAQGAIKRLLRIKAQKAGRPG